MFDNGHMNDRRQPPHVRQWRAVLNEHWPDKPAQFRLRDDKLLVRVRIVWDEFGEEFVDGNAVKWDSTHVYVEIDDRRLATNGVWLKPLDVYRRTPRDGRRSGDTPAP